MGKMKQLAMDREEVFWEQASFWAGCCEYRGQFLERMVPYRDKMAHMTNAELDELLTQAWDEKWSEYQ